MNKDSLIWDVKYRPKTFEDYIPSNEFALKKAQEYVKNQDIPHILYHGPAGVGKSLLAELIIDKLDCDLLRINASDENNVEIIRNKIKNFVTSISIGKKLKVVLLEEGDHISMQAQGILRDILETYINYSRFILTCNYYDKIIPAIKSRFKKGTYEIRAPKKPDVAKYISNILDKEEIKYTVDDVVKVVNNEYPDIRAMLGTIQVNIINNELNLDEDSLIESDYMAKIVEIFKNDKIKKYPAYTEIRKIISGARVTNFQPLIEYFYKYIDNISDQVDIKAGIILILAEVQVNDSFSINKEINIMSAIIKILGELKY